MPCGKVYSIRMVPGAHKRQVPRARGNSVVVEKAQVLLVDDDADFRAIVRGWLAPRYDVSDVSDGEGFLEELDAVEPDLVILDVRLPGPDGFDLCRRARACPRHAGVPVLFLTACREDEDFIRNLDVGGTAYLTKPVERKRLLSKIEELLS